MTRSLKGIAKMFNRLSLKSNYNMKCYFDAEWYKLLMCIKYKFSMIMQLTMKYMYDLRCVLSGELPVQLRSQR